MGATVPVLLLCQPPNRIHYRLSVLTRGKLRV